MHVPLYLHAFYRVGQRAGFVDEVSVLHVFRDPLEEAERLVEHDGHGDLGQLLHTHRHTHTDMKKMGNTKRQTHNTV